MPRSLWLTLLMLAGCVLGPRPEVCEADGPCREAFGLGWQCGDEGFCEQAEPHPRCDQTWPPDLLSRPEKYKDALVLGILFDATTDVPQRRSAELAVRQAHENGGLGGRTVGAVQCGYQQDNALDDLNNPDAVRAIARYAVDVLGAHVLVGPATSDLSAVAYDEVASDDVLILSPSATSPLLTTIDGEGSTDEDPGLFWRTAPPDDLQGLAIAADLAARGVGEVAILNKKGAYGTALADVIEANLAAGTVSHRFEFTNDTELTEAVVDAAFIANLEEVVFLSGDVEDLIAFLNGANTQSRFTDPTDPVEIFFADGGADPYLLTETQNASQLWPLIRGSRPQVPEGPVYDTFRAAYSSAYNGEDPSPAVYASFSFDAAWLALYGMAWATHQEAEIRGTTIARGLRRVSGPASAEVPVRASSWEAVQQAFEAGEAVDLRGASGPLDFDPATGETAIPIEIWVIEGGDFVAVELYE